MRRFSALFPWNYFFEEPRYTFYIASIEDRELFVLYLVVALVLGQLTSRIRRREKAEQERAERAKSLYLLTRELAEAGSRDELVSKAVQHLERSFNARAVILLFDSTGRLTAGCPPTFEITENELQFIERILKVREMGTGGVETFPQTNALVAVLKAHGDAEGVAVKAVTIVIAGNPPAPASHPSGANGKMVRVEMKAPQAPRAPSTPNFLFQYPNSSNRPKVHSEVARK